MEHQHNSSKVNLNMRFAIPGDRLYWRTLILISKKNKSLEYKLGEFDFRLTELIIMNLNYSYLQFCGGFFIGQRFYQCVDILGCPANERGKELCIV